MHTKINRTQGLVIKWTYRQMKGKRKGRQVVSGIVRDRSIYRFIIDRKYIHRVKFLKREYL